MTTPTPRWTAETEELVARTGLTSDSGHPWESAWPDTQAMYRRRAATILTALADAGVLIPVGGETRQEWGVLHDVFGIDGPVISRAGYEEDNEALARRMSTGSSSGLKLVRRTVHVGPWREVTDDPA